MSRVLGQPSSIPVIPRKTRAQRKTPTGSINSAPGPGLGKSANRGTGVGDAAGGRNASVSQSGRWQRPKASPGSGTTHHSPPRQHRHISAPPPSLFQQHVRCASTAVFLSSRRYATLRWTMAVSLADLAGCVPPWSRRELPSACSASAFRREVALPVACLPGGRVTATEPGGCSAADRVMTPGWRWHG